MEKELQKSCYQSSVSYREVVARYLPIFLSVGRINERDKSGRCRTENLRHDNFFDNGNTGFTLIELLVVVLIIGIFAAVAVPQYQKAVLKSRYTQAITLIHAMDKAETSYYLANGKYSWDWEELDIDFPAPKSVSNSNKYYYPWGYCYLHHTGYGVCYIKVKSGEYAGYEKAWNDNSFYCWAIPYTSARANEFCQQVTNNKNGTYSSGGGFQYYRFLNK